MSLQAYLSRTRTVLASVLANATASASAPSRGITVVMGNEACDLDSAVCAVALAYHLDSGPLGPAVPLLNIPRRDLRLRPDVRLVLADWLGARPELVPFRDDAPSDLGASALGQRLRLALVDHNVLRGPDAVLVPHVVMVIDHHAIEATWSAAVDTKIEPVGSCSSLVAQRLLLGDRAAVPAELARALRAAVLLDTVNLLPAAGKATPTDAAAIADLEAAAAICAPENAAVSRQAEFDALQAVRRDLSAFESADHLRRDFKAVAGGGVGVGLASLVMLAAQFLRREDGVQAARAFAAESGCSALLLLGTEVQPGGGGYRRDLAILPAVTGDGANSELVDRLAAFLASYGTPSLDLRPSAESPEATAAAEAAGGRLLEQGNAAASRKQLLPAVLQFLGQPAAS